MSKFLKKNERRNAHEEPEFTNLYVKSLGGDVTVEFLKDKFSKFGELRYVRIIRHAVGKSRGYGFVYFKLPNDAKAAMEALNGVQFGKLAASCIPFFFLMSVVYNLFILTIVLPLVRSWEIACEKSSGKS